MYAAVALVAPALFGRCETRGQRQANLPHIFVFEDGNPINRTRGVESPEAMPSEGNLYVHEFDGDSNTNTICYSGSPVGTFSEKVCCDDGVDCDFITVDKSIFSSPKEFYTYVQQQTPKSTKILTSAVECDRPSDRLTRTAAERSAREPEAAPFEFVSRADESACDCRSALPQFHSENYDIQSTYAHKWATTLRELPSGPNLLPNIESFGACNFFESGYGWTDDSEQGVMVPLIPRRDLAAEERAKVNASGFRIPLFEGQKEPNMPCDGNPNLQEDVNYCFFGDELLAEHVIRPADARELSIFCSENPIGPERTKPNRCCMEMTITSLDDAPLTIHAIRPDILLAAGCASVMRAPNNGDGAFHYFPGKNEPISELYKKVSGGYRESQLQRDLFVDPDARRLGYERDGFHQVCVPARLEEEPPRCFAFSPANVGADGFIGDGETATLLEDEFDLASGSGPGADYNERVSTLKSEPQTAFLKESRAFFKSCLLPETDSFGNPITTPGCDTVGLYSVQPFNFDEECPNVDDIPPFVQAWASFNDIDLQKAMIEWSKMPPSVYSSSGSFPLPPVDALTPSTRRCFQNADARVKPKDRQPISTMDDMGEFTCKTDCCLDPSQDVQNNGCQDQCSQFLRPLELIEKDNNEEFTVDDWKKIYRQCLKKEDQDKNYCKLAGQLYVDRPVFKRDEDVLPVYDRGTTETPYCEGRTDGAIVTDSTYIYFMGAGPRTRGLEHPMWEAGGYIGGSFDSPSFMREDSSTSFQNINLTAQRADSQVQMVAPNGNLVGVQSATSSLGGKPIVETVLGAIVADPSCYMENHRASRTEPYISIPGLFPRYLDLISGPNTQCAGDLTPGGDGEGFWTPSAVPFQDLYLRGGGRVGKIDDEYNGYVGLIKQTNSLFYQNVDGVNYALREDVGVCAAPDPNGCAGYCDGVGKGLAVAGSVFEAAAGVALAGIVTIFTGGAGDVALAAGEGAAVAAEGVEGAAVAATETASTAEAAASSSTFFNPAFDPDAAVSIEDEALTDTAEAAGDVEGAAGDALDDAEESAASAEKSVGQRALETTKKGLTASANKAKGIAKNTIKQVTGHPLRTLKGSILIADGIGRIQNSGSSSVDESGGVAAEKHWRNLIRAAIKTKTHPIARYEASNATQAYRELPSMIFTCIEGESKCFRDPGAKRESTHFQDPNIAEDKWNYMPGMLPTQTFASQLGCHTVFKQDGGAFKEEMFGFTAVVFNTSIRTRNTGYPRVTFQTIPSSSVRKFTDGKVYHAGTQNDTYLPTAQEKYLKCSMCGLFTGYFTFTVPVDECEMVLPDRSTRKMMYNIGNTSVYDHVAARKMKGVNWFNVTEVQMKFRSGGEQTKVWKKNMLPTDNAEEARMVQRYLGFNLTSLGSLLADPPCLGDTSTMTSMCSFDNTLRIKPTEAVECVDNTTAFSGACINPIWANDNKIIFPNSNSFDARAELLSYCANVFTLNSEDLFSSSFYEKLLSDERGYQPLFNPESTQFVQCANDRLSLEERLSFCRGSDIALSGSSAVLGLRAKGRTDISQVCNFEMRQCLLYPDDPGEWTISKVVDALKAYGSAEPYTLLFLPVSFNVLVNIPIFATSVATTFYNSPQSAGPDAFMEAAAIEPVFEDINVTWSASEELVQGVCPPGGPRVSKQAKVFGLVWALVEGMSKDSKKYTIISFDGLGQNQQDQRTVYTRAKVYPTIQETEIKPGLQKFVVRSAFDAETSKYATLARPHLEKRFQPIDLVFSGDPPPGAASCTRFFIETELSLSGVSFKQDSPGCKVLPASDRTPIVATGQSIGNTLLHYTTCVGCPAHGLVARGFDTSVYRDRVSANLDVGGLAVVGTSLRLEWPDTTCTDKAMKCANLDSFSGVSLALARTQGNAEVVSCPAAQLSGRCYAENEREPTYLFFSDDKESPMFSWYSKTRPTNCTNTVPDDYSEPYSNATYCFQGYEWRNDSGEWAATSLLESSNQTFSVPPVNDGRVVTDSECTQEVEVPINNGQSTTTVGVLLRADAMYKLQKNASTLVAPWFGYYGNFSLIVTNNSVPLEHAATGAAAVNGSDHRGSLLLVDHESVEANGRILKPGDRVKLNESYYFVHSYALPAVVGAPAKLELMTDVDSTAPVIFTENEIESGMVLYGGRTVKEEPCAPNDFALFSDGAVFIGENVSDDVALYGITAELTHKCSGIGCLGGIDTSFNVPRCKSAFTMDYTIEDGRYFMWHGILVDPEQEIFGLRQDGTPGKIGLGLKVRITGNGDGAIAGTALRNLVKIGSENDQCIQRMGDNTLQEQPCRVTEVEQQWLLVADGAFFRVEVPGDPYTCIFRNGTLGDPIMVPCPACMVGSGSFVVDLSDADPANLPVIKNVDPFSESQFTVGIMRIPLSLDDNTVYLSVDTATGYCMCDTVPRGAQGKYECPCSLKRVTKDTVIKNTEDPLICKHAIGPLLSVCDKLGGGLAAVDGYRVNMIEACRVLEVDRNKRFSGAGNGRGAMFECNAQRNMVHVIDPGDFFVDGEEISGMVGITAVVNKVILQPYETGIPSVVTAPYSLEVNVTDFLTPFGGALHRLAAQSFSSEASIWAAVIAELSIITAAVLLQVCLLGKSASKVETVMTNAQMRYEKKIN